MGRFVLCNRNLVWAKNLAYLKYLLFLDFPTIVTSDRTKGFPNRFEIPHVFTLGLSIRGNGDAEIFLCEGWTPLSYSCYHINIGGLTYLGKTKNSPDYEEILDDYKVRATTFYHFDADLRVFLGGRRENAVRKRVEELRNTTGRKWKTEALGDVQEAEVTGLSSERR